MLFRRRARLRRLACLALLAATTPLSWTICAEAIAAPPVAALRDFGAVCDGRSDDSAAIARAISFARANAVPVQVPQAVCAYGDVIRLDGAKLVGSGDASVLHALDWSRAAIFMFGEGAEVRYLRLTGVKAPSRQSAWEATRITLFGATRFVIDRVTIEGSAAAGIQTADAAGDGRISRNRISDTLADSIHLTDRAHGIVVQGNRIERSGDDGIAVVSYQGDGARVDRIAACDNHIVDNLGGRLMSVVGGSNILYENNRLENNRAGYACLYIAQEDGYATFGARDVLARRNTLMNCGGEVSGHGAVMIFSDGSDSNNRVTLSRNSIVQNGQSGIRVLDDMNFEILLDSNRIRGADPALDVQTPGVKVKLYRSGPAGTTGWMSACQLPQSR